jgi:hypothetical protein
MAQVVITGLLPWWPTFNPRKVGEGFVVDHEELRQVFLLLQKAVGPYIGSGGYHWPFIMVAHIQSQESW